MHTLALHVLPMRSIAKYHVGCQPEPECGLNDDQRPSEKCLSETELEAFRLRP